MDLNSENITGMLWVSPSCPAPRFVTSFWREVVYQSKGTYSFFYIYTHLKKTCAWIKSWREKTKGKKKSFSFS